MKRQTLLVGLLVILSSILWVNLSQKDIHSKAISGQAVLNTHPQWLIQPRFVCQVNEFSNFKETMHIDAMAEKFLQEWELKGMAMAIVKDGKLVYAKGFGYADQQRQIKAEPYHLFRIASVSKLYTAVGIMKLVEQGKLKLDDKIFGENGILNDPKYTDKIANPLALKIEVQHLLTHTAGWWNQLRTDPMFVPVAVANIMKVKSPPSLETTIEYMLSQTKMFEPGSMYDYSNFGYCVLDKVIEKVSGMKYEAYMQEKILKPIGITRMKISKNRLKDRHPFEARYYTHYKAKKNISVYDEKDSASRAYEGSHIEGLGAAGGWAASVIDLARFVGAIDGFDTQPDILKKSTIEAMVQPAQQDSTGKLVIGWKNIDEEKWWRTGSLEGTGIALARQHNGITWVVVTNTSTWRGPFFSYEIAGLMRRILQNTPQFPDIDLFELTN
jgi:CubicO group peptidase (beta-lactamase class C family)